MLDKVLVSICCITYNHEPFIRECLNGFIMQETDFAFEVLIHDDASTDDTADIIREYESKYPDIIKPIYQTENQWVKGRRGSVIFNFPRAKGKYIALCEGDDYWTDPLKLQKQVDFLEENVEYGLVHGDSDFYYQDKNTWKHAANRGLSNTLRNIDKEDLFYRIIDHNYIIRTATVLFRNTLLASRVPNDVTFLMGDTPMWLDFSQNTKFKYFDEVFTVYRISSGTASRPKKVIDALRFKLSIYEMKIYYLRKYNYKIKEYLIKGYDKALANYTIFDPTFEPLYPLFGLNIKNRIKIKYSSRYFINILFKTEFYLMESLKKIYRRVKYST